jgi:CRISPR-associated protein Csx17
MPEIELAGCTPEPLLGYLKALGVFRLASEQADRAAALSWQGGVARLRSGFERDALTDFFLAQYLPTPILAPWNADSGFFDEEEPESVLGLIRCSTSPRLSNYRDAVRVTDAVVRPMVETRRQLKELERKKKSLPKGDKTYDEEIKLKRQELERRKSQLQTALRQLWPDDILPWFDSVMVLDQERQPSYPPLLGTGGNDGRLDFTNNFLQRLADVLPFKADAPPPHKSAGWLASALFGDDTELTPLDRAAVGQFNPGGIGGANGVQGKFEAGSRVNPWDFVLMIEGALLFAGSVARRLGANVAGRAVFPFTVNSVAVGYGSAAASEETTDGSRAELWLPLWEKPAGLSEVRQLFAEGRAQVGRRQARNAVEFALAACLLGVSRGVQQFVRYGFLKRNGLAFLAAPLGRVAVTPRPAARLLEDAPLTEWVERLRSACRDKDKTPARYQSALRNLDRALFEFAVRSQTDETADRPALLRALRALGQAERTLAGGLAFCKDNYVQPLNGLSPQWLTGAAPEGDAGREFRLAAALASVLAERETPVGPLRTHLEEVEQNRGRVAWESGHTSAVWTNRLPSANLAAVLLRRLTESERAGVKGLALRSRVFAPLPDVVAFLHRQTNDELLADLLWALIGLKWNDARFPWPRFHMPLLAPPPKEFGLIRLVLRPVRLAIEPRPRDEPRWRAVRGRDQAAIVTTPAGVPFQRLARGDLSQAVALAARRLWSDRLVPFGWANRRRRQGDYPADANPDPVRLLAACLFPLSGSSLTRLARQALGPPVPVS